MTSIKRFAYQTIYIDFEKNNSPPDWMKKKWLKTKSTSKYCKSQDFIFLHISGFISFKQLQICTVFLNEVTRTEPKLLDEK